MYGVNLFHLGELTSDGALKRGFREGDGASVTGRTCRLLNHLYIVASRNLILTLNWGSKIEFMQIRKLWLT